MTSKVFEQELIDSVKGDIFFALLHHPFISPYQEPNKEIIALLIEEDYRNLLGSLSWRCDREHKTRWWKALIDMLNKVTLDTMAAIKEILSRLKPDIEKREVRATNMNARWRRAIIRDMAEDGNLQKWMRACDEMANDLDQEEQILLYQCFMQKLLRVMLMAFEQKSEELMGWVYKF